MKRYVSYLDFQFKVLTLFVNPLSQSFCEKFELHKNDVTKQKTSLRRDSLYSKYYQYSLNTCHLRIARNSTNASDSGFPLELFVNTRSHVRAGHLASPTGLRTFSPSSNCSDRKVSWELLGFTNGATKHHLS